jgi:hypothetical protein
MKSLFESRSPNALKKEKGLNKQNAEMKVGVVD